MMTKYILSFKPAIKFFGFHDPSTALFKDGRLVFACEEERLSRNKHAPGEFPTGSIKAALEFEAITMDDIAVVALPYVPELAFKKYKQFLRRTLSDREETTLNKADYSNADKKLSGKIIFHNLNRGFVKLSNQIYRKYMPTMEVEKRLREIGDSLPPIVLYSHHRCHAAGAYYPSGFDESLVFTLDGEGEYDSTVVWHGSRGKLKRLRTFDRPNSLGHFFAVVTKFLGYRPFNGEGKVMGLAAYGSENNLIENRLRDVAEFSREYDVTEIVGSGTNIDTNGLELILDRRAKNTPDNFDQFDKDLAYTAQKLLEESVTDLIQYHIDETGVGNVCLSGGVALNCKLNKKVRELPQVTDLYIQPVAHDGGLSLGAGWIEAANTSEHKLESIYLGPNVTSQDVGKLLESSKIEYTRPDDVEMYAAERLAEGELVGWVRGRLEMGPRALGNRSILADPRKSESRDKVNKYVKHRETWRPFAPAILADKADRYLVDAKSSKYMIETFDTKPDTREQIPAVLHPADYTTRPQIVEHADNPHFHNLLEKFESLTGVPVLLNTSFNVSGEPMVSTASDALRDFYVMGLDHLIICDYAIEK